MNEGETWTDRDDAERDFDSLPVGHPSRVVTEFHTAILDDDTAAEDLASYVAFHSRAGWADFGRIRSYFMDQAVAIATRALRPRGTSHVAYVKLVADDGNYLSATPRQDVLAYVTLLWEEGWKVYGIGESLNPEVLPPATPGDPAPTYDNDVAVVRD